jgi:chemotaxis receptor (MCP) glutamine deamidase CheD
MKNGSQAYPPGPGTCRQWNTAVVRRRIKTRKEAPVGFQEETVSFGGIAIAGQQGSLVAPPVGSGVTVVVYEPDSHVGGMAHMPCPERSSNLGSQTDHRLESLVQLLTATGAVKSNFRCVIVGGARHPHEAKLGEDLLWPVMEKSIESSKDYFERLGVAELTSEIGGVFGRTCSLRVTDGHLTVTSGDGRETLFIMGRS